MDKEKNVTVEDVKDAVMKAFSLCRKCKHENVCKYLQERDGQAESCKDFLNAGDHKTYGNIYSLFQPIFDWLNYHHPHGEVKFVVSNTSAQMYLEHGPFVASEELKKPLYSTINAEHPQSETKEAVKDTQEV